tara:strand:- start:526 stop:1254 length:729 start_codon:yes stop_codon:yes gene_type:complete
MRDTPIIKHIVVTLGIAMKADLVEQFSATEQVHLETMYDYASSRGFPDECHAVLDTMLELALSDTGYKKKLDLWLSGRQSTVFLRDELFPEAWQKANVENKERYLLKDNVWITIDSAKHISGNAIDITEIFGSEAGELYRDMLEAFKSLPNDEEHVEAKRALMWYVGRIQCQAPEFETSTALLHEGAHALLVDLDPDRFTGAITKACDYQEYLLPIERFNEIVKECQEVTLSKYHFLRMQPA